MTKRRFWQTVLLSLCLAAALALPAFAQEEYGEPNITPQTKMEDIRKNPSIIGAGIYTYSLDQWRPVDRAYWNNQTLNRVSNRYTAQDCADGLNYLIRLYNRGQQVTYPLYTKEEIRKDWSRSCAELYYMPVSDAEQTDPKKFVLVVPGNAIVVSAELREGISTAWNFHQMGYPVFVLRYRVGATATNNAPMKDLARAVQYITEHAEQFGVQAEDYALVGFSSGGQLAGLFGTDKMGYKNYGLPKPGALLLGYPVNTFYEMKPLYRKLLDPLALTQRYYEITLSRQITEDYPPTYHWYGKNDVTLMTMNWAAQGPALERALQQNNVTHLYRVYDNAPHAIGAGKGTDAEGWLNDAVAFWEAQTVQEE